MVHVFFEVWCGLFYSDDVFQWWWEPDEMSLWFDISVRLLVFVLQANFNPSSKFILRDSHCWLIISEKMFCHMKQMEMFYCCISFSLKRENLYFVCFDVFFNNYYACIVDQYFCHRKLVPRNINSVASLSWDSVF